MSVDALLSGEELLTIAEADHKEKENHARDLVFGLLDLSAGLMFVLPFFGETSEGIIRGVSLAALQNIGAYLKGIYVTAVIAIAVLGILTLALQNCRKEIWIKNKSKLSLGFNMAGVLLFIISSQPYVAAFLFAFLMIKVIMLIKWQ